MVRFAVGRDLPSWTCSQVALDVFPRSLSILFPLDSLLCGAWPASQPKGTSQWPRVGAHRIRNPSSRVSDPKKGRKVDETKDQGEHPVHPERSWSMLVRRTVETS